MSEPFKKKFVSRKFQRFIAVARVLVEPELKTMKAMNPREGEPDTIPYCRVFCSTGSPYGENSDAVFTVQLKGKQAELFCKEPRKGHDFLFDCQLRTYKIKREGGGEDTRTEFSGSFNFIEPHERQDTSVQAELPVQTPRAAPVADKSKTDEDVPF